MAKKQTKKKKVSKTERQLEKDLLKIVGFIVILVLIFVIASAVFRSFNTFEYEGLTFTKERFGNLPVYHHIYYFDGPNGELNQYNLFVRTDPRENLVMVESNALIEFDQNRPAYIAVNEEGLEFCRYDVLGVATLVTFLTDNQIPVRNAQLTEEQANSTVLFDNEGNITRGEVVTCENKPGNAVVNIFKGDETKITVNENCYDISINNCEMLEAIEKFQVQTILDARERVYGNATSS